MMEKMKMMVPELRFPGFSGEWEEKKFRNLIIESKLGGNYENAVANKGVPVIKMGNLGRGDINLNKVQYLPENKSYNEDDILKTSDLLFNTRNTLELVGKVSIWRNELPFALYNSNLMRLKFNELIEPSNQFMNYLFNIKKSIEQLRSIANGTPSVAAIYGKDLNHFRASFPSLTEQQKIASFLTAVDEKLQALKKKKDLLMQYKKGMMQKIFSQELRFKDDDGNEFPEWEEKMLGEVGTFIGGGTPSTKTPSFWNGDIPWISSSDLTDESIFRINTTRFITSEAVLKTATKQIPEKSVLIVSRVGVGKVAVNEVALCTSQDFTNLILYSDNYIFFAYLLKLKTNKLLEFNQGTSIKGFVKNDLEALQIAVPSLPEQTKIANFLSAIDEKINLCATRIEKTKQYKKGLLQKMFV